MKEKLDILFLNPDPRRGAGSNISLLGIIAGLDRSRYSVHMAVPGDNEYQDKLEALGVNVLDFRINNWWYPTEAYLYRHLAGIRDRVALLVSAIRERDIDLLYTNAEYAFEGALAAATAGIPHVWAQRVMFGADIDVLKHFPFSEAALAQLMAELSDIVVPNSNATLHAFSAYVPSDKLRVIESGMEVSDRLSPKREAGRSFAAMAGIPDSSRIVLTVGRISPEKDIATFIRTAALVLENPLYSNVHFVHVGSSRDTTYQSELTALSRALGVDDRVHFLGSVELGEISKIYRGADVFLLTSTFEGFARVGAEAMLAELPTISTRCGGSEDYILEADTGFLCDVGDVTALAKRVTWILDNPEPSIEMGKRARVLIARRYDMNMLNAKWMALFEEMVSRPRTVYPERVLRMELLINMLAHIGKTGMDNHALRLRLVELERPIHFLKNNSVTRAVRFFLRPFFSRTGHS